MRIAPARKLSRSAHSEFPRLCVTDGYFCLTFSSGPVRRNRLVKQMGFADLQDGSCSPSSTGSAVSFSINNWIAGCLPVDPCLLVAMETQAKLAKSALGKIEQKRKDEVSAKVATSSLRRY